MKIPTQSATSIADYKVCPNKYRIKHVLRIRPIEKPDHFRIGTNWHKCLEISKLTPGDLCGCVSDPGSPPDPRCPICDGAGAIPEDLRMALVRYMNAQYEVCPSAIDAADWEVEKLVLLYSALGWQWYWQDDQIKTLACEISFDREVRPGYRRRGIIDRILLRDGVLGIGEYKSTGKPIDPGSLFWKPLQKDSQPTLYLIEARIMQLAGDLELYGIKATDPLISGVLYDVWRKPAISPKKLSQADTKKFMVDGMYFEEKFLFSWEGDTVLINNVVAETTAGSPPKPTKKNPNPETPFAIRETPEMFGARLLADIRENPEKHFARKPISRTDLELERADREFGNIHRLAELARLRDIWFSNEHQCNATYQCQFHPICYDSDLASGEVPEGFRRLDEETH